jgi:hemerythrin-like metal-binding protein
MTLIRWQDSFKLGIPEIDLEHRELIDLINVVHARSADPNGRTGVDDALGQIVARVSVHFANEERTMLALEFPEYWSHKDHHDQLLDALSGIIAKYQVNRDLDPEDLSRRLESWFMVHLRTFDARFHRFAHDRREIDSPNRVG